MPHNIALCPRVHPGVEADGYSSRYWNFKFKDKMYDDSPAQMTLKWDLIILWKRGQPLAVCWDGGMQNPFPESVRR